MGLRENHGGVRRWAQRGTGSEKAARAVEAIEGGELLVENLQRVFTNEKESVHAVDDVSFAVQPGEFYTLLGPSGCGKTTSLRCVAGLETPTSGHIMVDGRTVFITGELGLPSHERNIGMVFQSYAIWPHMSVYANVSFPLRFGHHLHLSKAEVQERVEEALAVVRLESYSGRMATQLSGGQQQRLALARALVSRPKLLLLDEPLSNLDAGLRERLRAELRALQQRTGVTTLYVTHDQAEAFSLSSRIGVMSSGRIVQEGTPQSIYLRPRTTFVATFVGRTNMVPVQGVQASAGSTIAEVETELGRIHANVDGIEDLSQAEGLIVRPENVQVSESALEASTGTVFEGTVTQATFLGDVVEYEIRVGDFVFLSRQHPTTTLSLDAQVSVRFPAETTVVVVQDEPEQPDSDHAGREAAGHELYA